MRMLENSFLLRRSISLFLLPALTSFILPSLHLCPLHSIFTVVPSLTFELARVARLEKSLLNNIPLSLSLPAWRWCQNRGEKLQSSAAWKSSQDTTDQKTQFLHVSPLLQSLFSRPLPHRCSAVQSIFGFVLHVDSSLQFFLCLIAPHKASLL